MDIARIQKTYRRYANVYDVCFGAIFQPGRKTVIDQMHCQPGDKILEVGVGTGLSLPSYPDDVQITGIDLSQEMLAKAQRLTQRQGMEHVTLHEMDAEAMTFADHQFDKVVAMYVASVVPNPVTLVKEMQRVCRPGGDLFIVNHFSHHNSVIGRLEKLASPLAGWLGFHPDFALDKFIGETNLTIHRQQPVNLMGYWTLLHSRNH